MGKLKESLAGPGYVILNTIRAINIIVFLDIIASCVVMEVKIHMLNGFFFFQAVTHAVMALITSEYRSICLRHVSCNTFHEMAVNTLFTQSF